MAKFSYQVGRQIVYWTDHALDRWWERCMENELLGRGESLNLLRERLRGTTKIVPGLPPWGNVSRWHRARAEGMIYLDENSGFIVNRNATGDYVAVTYIESDLVIA